MSGLKYFLILLILFLPMGVSAALTAPEILAKAASQIDKTSGIECKFILNSGGKDISGVLRSSGNKFSIETAGASTWYNGKNMWSYNASSAETTLTVPTSQELSEVNPFSYLKGYAGMFNALFSKKKSAGKYLIVLTPKKKNSAIKSVEIVIDSKSFRPERIIMQQGSSRITVTVKSLVMGKRFGGGFFEYPVSKYPSVEIIDLR